MLVEAADSVVPGSSSAPLAAIAAKMDRKRIHQAVVAAKEETKTSRKRKALARLRADETLAADEGHLYRPGGH